MVQAILFTMINFVTCKVVKKVLIIIMLVIISACGSSKSSMKSEAYIDASRTKKEVSTVSEQVKVIESDTTLEVVELETIVFDTSIKDEKGYHPVLSVTRSKATKGNVKETNTEAVKEQETSTKEVETIGIKEKTDQRSEIKETTLPKQWASLIWGILLLIIVFILWKKRIFAHLL